MRYDQWKTDSGYENAIRLSWSVLRSHEEQSRSLRIGQSGHQPRR
jgi:hypothetical protein